VGVLISGLPALVEPISGDGGGLSWESDGGGLSWEGAGRQGTILGIA
jgi:hypothetical protein